MKKYEGIHLYININNLNSIIRKDENNNDDLKRSFHALNTFTWGLEQFAVALGNVEIEKFTTSRYHFYFQLQNKDDAEKEKIIYSMIDLITFAYDLANKLTEIGKYNKLSQFKIGVGADFGVYTEYNYTDSENKYNEMTTIGSPANRAAKLQSKCTDGNILISNVLFNILPDNICGIFKLNSEFVLSLYIKYTGLSAYETSIYQLSKFTSNGYENRSTDWLNKCVEYANSTNLSDVNFSDAQSKLDFTNLSLVQSKQITNAIILFSDIRGFTNKVDNEEDLSKIKNLTQEVLQKMNKATNKENGVHVQFQGDRESAIFHPYSNEPKNFVIRAISAAMRMIDFVKEINDSKQYGKLNIGIGCDYGSVFATRIGMRNRIGTSNRKFNVVMGKTVKNADTAEDEVAGVVGGISSKTEVAITKEMFEKLKEINSSQSQKYEKLFLKRKVLGKEYYICTTGYKEFQEKADNVALQKNASRASNNNRICPWGE